MNRLKGKNIHIMRGGMTLYHIKGHHHISMITKHADQNNDFYIHVLGLRRVKMSVNQDEPSMYHLFYGDRVGSPGTDLTFFEIPSVGRTYRGTNAITTIGLMIPSEASLMYWKERFETFDVQHSDITTYAQHRALYFEDEDGLRMVLLVTDGEKFADWEPWKDSPVPEKHQIMGMGPVEITVRNLNKFTRTFTEMLGYTEISRTTDEAVLQAREGNLFDGLVVKALDGPAERPGRGSIHHLAICVNNEEELAYWDAQVRQRGFQSSGIVDRYYFKSVYFRESNGIVIELATDGPGFTVDEPIETLGKQLQLPPFLEERRVEIEGTLRPLK